MFSRNSKIQETWSSLGFLFEDRWDVFCTAGISITTPEIPVVLYISSLAFLLPASRKFQHRCPVLRAHYWRVSHKIVEITNGHISHHPLLRGTGIGFLPSWVEHTAPFTWLLEKKRSGGTSESVFSALYRAGMYGPANNTGTIATTGTIAATGTTPHTATLVNPICA